MKKFIKIVSIITLSVLISSCCNCRKGSPKIADLEERSWTLVELKGAALPESGISLRFDPNDKMVYGTAPCNNFFGGFFLTDDKENNIKIGNMGATRKYCPDSQNENEFTRLLSTVTKVEIQGSTLFMTNPEGETVAILTAK